MSLFKLMKTYRGEHFLHVVPLLTLRTSCRSCCGSMQVSIRSNKSMMADVPICFIIKSTKSSRFRRKSTIYKHSIKNKWTQTHLKNQYRRQTIVFPTCKIFAKHSVHVTRSLVMGWILDDYLLPTLKSNTLLTPTHLLRLASYKNGEDFGEEASQERIERRFILEKAIQFHQQFFIFTQSVIDLAHIWCKQLTWYVGIPERKQKEILTFFSMQWLHHCDIMFTLHKLPL